MHDESWEKIFKDYNIYSHNFDKEPFQITNKDIKKSVQKFKKTSEKEVRILCKQDSREARPEVFKNKDLFLLPIKNGTYIIVKGEGFVDLPEIEKTIEIYTSKLDFHLDSSLIGNSEMQHLDFAYAVSLIRTFVEDNSLVLTIRGRKYTPSFEFIVNNYCIKAKSVQTEVDAGYEGRDKIVLVEAKNTKVRNTIIRQIYYPFRQWQQHTSKKVVTVFFEKRQDMYLLWEYQFKDINNYNSIELVKSGKYKIKHD